MKKIAAYLVAPVLALTALPLAAQAQVTGSVSVDSGISGAVGDLGVGVGVGAGANVDADSRRRSETRRVSVRQQTMADTSGGVEIRLKNARVSSRTKARSSTVIESDLMR